MFYKIIYNNIIIDIVQSPAYVRYIKKSDRFLTTDASSAHGIVDSHGSDIYLLKNASDSLNDLKLKHKVVSMIEISESEYFNLKSQLTEVMDKTGEIIDIKTLQEEKISEMNAACNRVITDGFDIVLSDGINYHFSLEITDQMKISKLNDRAVNGVTELPWHADNGLCKFYKADDIIAINEKMEYFIEYHTTYFNSLKNYIKNIGDKEIVDIYYGIEIPKPYQSEVLMKMLSVMNGGI